jgi:hypothetical protein
MQQATGLQTKLCFLKDPPSERLSNFGCLVDEFPGAREITCVKPAESTDIAEYWANFRASYAQQQSNYTRLATACPIANGGDATPGPPSTAPPLINKISKYELGWVLPIAKRGQNVGGSMISHGYATANSSAATGVEAIEYLHGWVTLKMPPGSDTTSNYALPNGWRVSVDTTGTNSPLADAMRAQFPVSALTQAQSFSVTRSLDIPPAFATKVSLNEDWADSIADVVEGLGFREVSDDDYERYVHMTKQEYRDRISETGRQYASASHADLGDNVHLFYRQDRPNCAGDNGAIAVLLMNSHPIEADDDDYGSVSIVVIGLGTCGRAEDDTRKYMEAVREQVRAKLTGLIREER